MDKKTLLFHGECAAHSSKVLCSYLITRPFKIKSVGAHFALNTNDTLAIRFFSSDDKATPTSGAPTGASVLSELSPDDYISGDDSVIKYETNWTVEQGSTYVKIYAVNSDAAAHTINAFCEIEYLEEN